MPDIYETLRKLYPTLSKGRKRVVDYLLSHREDAPFISAANLGKEAGISESAVVRFTASMGYPHYSDMQEELRLEMKKSMRMVDRMKTFNPPSNSMESVFQSVFSTELANIDETCKGLDLAQLDALADQIIAAKHVGIAAIRGAYSPAVVLNLFLNQFLNNAVLLNPGIYDAHPQMREWGEGDVVIALLFYIDSQYIEEILAYAKSKKCHVVGITNNPAISMARYCNQLFLTKTDGTVVSYTATTLLVNVLLSVIFNKLEARPGNFIGKMEEFEEMLRAVTL